ncbi:amino acid ABC transporter substrate-binding protein [Waterburya agarophytonicola K14]|uniref:Amino acid ABC transporter substrate-binding protein n=1 Tax=Waterburya agarophytonicola KI4 TaxID=2874699 RepID=A0A964BP51_9CYAN|nr:ABC transporter substrate-binding protein [Waterburya agarophytonicola]MCC0175591.1 amino acid ABC transporter substrate-binding protein [Waterburya agarophytonicola KI4]
MSSKKETTVLLLTLLITISAIAGGLWWFNKNKQESFIVDSNKDILVPVDESPSPQISAGNEILISEGVTPEKEAGRQAISDGDYPQAVSFLEESLSRKPNDPEALIYLNNARIGQNKAYSIAVPVPIGTEITTSEEILRGVAQAQNEINQQGGINGVPLKVLIVNDDNDPQTAKAIAQNLVKNKDILAVVGHFSSGVTLAAAPIYQENGLVAISPSSTSVAISKMGNNIFRTVPSDRFTSNAIAEYALKKLNKNRAVVVYNSQSAYSNSLRDTFTTDLVSNGGEIAIEVDLSQGNYNPAEILQKAQIEQADILVFLNDSTTLDKSYLMVQLNNNQLPMLAGDSFYKPQTLQIAGEKAVGLVLAVPWHISSNTNSDFPESSRRLWGGDVNWRTAMAYDAVQAIIAGLTGDPSRQGIQKTLSQSGFSFDGASGKVKFLASGDRNSPVQLVTVQPGKRSSYGYDFEIVK